MPNGFFGLFDTFGQRDGMWVKCHLPVIFSLQVGSGRSGLEKARLDQTVNILRAAPSFIFHRRCASAKTRGNPPKPCSHHFRYHGLRVRRTMPGEQ